VASSFYLPRTCPTALTVVAGPGASCASRANLGLVIGLLSTIVIWPMALASIAVFQGHPVTYWSVVNCVLFPALLTFSIAIHEAGHAIAACMVGLRVAQVEVGVGRRVARWRWRETTIVVHALPFGGFTRPISVRVPESRWRYAACVAAGPLATLAIVVAVMFWPTPLGFLQGLFPTEATAGRFAARDLLAFINITALAAGVISLAEQRWDGGQRRDAPGRAPSAHAGARQVLDGSNPSRGARIVRAG
jgi:hypothetical protein